MIKLFFSRTTKDSYDGIKMFPFLMDEVGYADIKTNTNNIMKGKFVYEVEMYDSKNERWKEKETRYYNVKQNVEDFPDNKMRRNFKKI